jgi:hypothetical protein
MTPGMLLIEDALLLLVGGISKGVNMFERGSGAILDVGDEDNACDK